MSLIRCCLIFSCLVLLSAFSRAQSSGSSQKDRIAAQPELRATTRLADHVPAWASMANDRGAVDGDTAVRVTFALSRSPDLQTSFVQLLADQQNPESARYHRWLTPQEVGEQYGPTQHDVDALANWMSSQGLTVVEVAPSRLFVSANAGVMVSKCPARESGPRGTEARCPAGGVQRCPDFCGHLRGHL